MDIGEVKEYEYGVDSIVIRHYIRGIAGGKVLDVTGFTPELIKAGHIIIRSTDQSQKITYKPLGVNNGAYVSLPQGYEYCGVATGTVPTSEPLVGIMYNGEVNDVCSPYPITSALKTALAAALPMLKFEHDD